MAKHRLLVKLRKERRLTQKELAKTIGTTRQTIINIENGDFPMLETAKKLEKFFCQELFTISDDGTLKIREIEKETA